MFVWALDCCFKKDSKTWTCLLRKHNAFGDLYLPEQASSKDRPLQLKVNMDRALISNAVCVIVSLFKSFTHPSVFSALTPSVFVLLFVPVFFHALCFPFHSPAPCTASNSTLPSHILYSNSLCFIPFSMP